MISSGEISKMSTPGAHYRGAPAHHKKQKPNQKRHNTEKAHAEVATPRTHPTAQHTVSKAHLSQTTFSSLPISPASIKAVEEVLAFTHLTKVQDATLPIILRGQDVLAKAKTGTGKTIAFLLPAIEKLVRSPPPPVAGNAKPIFLLVLSPTRELASQIGKECAALLTYHPLKCQVVYGGTNISSERKRLDSQPCDVLVATPGRLIDHLENHPTLAKRIASGLSTLVLDEADQLLEMGFRPAVEQILTFLPRKRQTLLFSATLPQGVKQVAGLALKSDHAFIDTVGEESHATNVQVTQHYVEVPLEQTLVAIRCIVRAAAAVPDHKIIIFCTTARLTQYMAALLNETGIPCLEIHSRKSQPARDKASKAFRQARQAIMFTSDVSARGVDYPNVTLVLQVGVPSSKEQYIHRLGRTARAGKGGQGVLVLAPFERRFVDRELTDIPITQASLPAIVPEDIASVSAALQRLEPRLPEMAYQAWLGYYNSTKGVFSNKIALVETANMWATAVMGLSQPPALLKKTIGMMGLRGVPGLRVEQQGNGSGNGDGNGGGRRQEHRMNKSTRDGNGGPAQGNGNGSGVEARHAAVSFGGGPKREGGGQQQQRHPSITRPEAFSNRGDTVQEGRNDRKRSRGGGKFHRRGNGPGRGSTAAGTAQ